MDYRLFEFDTADDVTHFLNNMEGDIVSIVYNSKTRRFCVWVYCYAPLS